MQLLKVWSLFKLFNSLWNSFSKKPLVRWYNPISVKWWQNYFYNFTDEKSSQTSVTNSVLLQKYWKDWLCLDKASFCKLKSRHFHKHCNTNKSSLLDPNMCLKPPLLKSARTWYAIKQILLWHRITLIVI